MPPAGIGVGLAAAEHGLRITEVLPPPILARSHISTQARARRAAAERLAMSTRVLVALDRVSAWHGALGAGGGTVLNLLEQFAAPWRQHSQDGGSCWASLSDP